MDIITFRNLIGLVVSKKIEYELKDLVTAYFYAELDTIIPKLMSSLPRNTLSIRLKLSLYGLRQFERMWYKRLTKYLISEWNMRMKNCASTCPIKTTNFGFGIIDMNLIGTLEKI